MTQYFSDKIKVLSFVSIILVLYIHSGFHNTPNEIQGMAFNHYLQGVISGMVGRCAVPLFYAISGYLFFLHTDEGMPAIFKKMRKRVKTLLVPFVIAALFFPAFLLCMELLPFAKGFTNSADAFSNNLQLPLGEILMSLFYAKEGGTSPWAFHLWFLRDLIIIVALSPLLHIIKKANGGGIMLLILYIVTFYQTKYFPAYALFWFIAGDMFLIRLKKLKSAGFPIAFVLLAVTELALPDLPWKYFRIPVVALGIVSIWNLYGRVASETFDLKEHRWLAVACQFTFFIYLFHEPTLNVVRKLLILPLGRSSMGFAVNYLVSPWLFAVLFILVGYCFKKYLPHIYSVCVGGR